VCTTRCSPHKGGTVHRAQCEQLAARHITTERYRGHRVHNSLYASFRRYGTECRGCSTRCTPHQGATVQSAQCAQLAVHLIKAVRYRGHSVNNSPHGTSRRYGTERRVCTIRCTPHKGGTVQRAEGAQLAVRLIKTVRYRGQSVHNSLHAPSV
jgi:hypothetical protein